MDPSATMTSQTRTANVLEIEERLKLIRAKRRLLQLQFPNQTPQVSIEIAEYDVEEAELEPLLRRANEHPIDMPLPHEPAPTTQNFSIPDPRLTPLPFQSPESMTLSKDSLSSHSQLFSRLEPLIIESESFDDFIDWSALDSTTAMDIEYNSFGGYQADSAFEQIGFPELNVHGTSFGGPAAAPLDDMQAISMQNGLPLAPEEANQVSINSLPTIDFTTDLSHNPSATTVNAQWIAVLATQDQSRLPNTLLWQHGRMDGQQTKKRKVTSEELTPEGETLLRGPTGDVGGSVECRGRTVFRTSEPLQGKLSFPGTGCFYSRPPPKRSRKAPTMAEQQEINKIRLRGACLRCRRLRLKCSEEDPCRNCVIQSTGTAFKDLVLATCVRSFQEANIFTYWDASTINYNLAPLNLDLIRDSGSVISFLRLFCLFIDFEYYELCVSQSDKVWNWRKSSMQNAGSWKEIGTKALLALDRTLAKKSFWAKANLMAKLAALCVVKLVLDFCLYNTFYAYLTLKKDFLGRSRRRKSLEDFIQISVFDMEKLFTIRAMLISHLGIRIRGDFLLSIGRFFTRRKAQSPHNKHEAMLEKVLIGLGRVRKKDAFGTHWVREGKVRLMPSSHELMLFPLATFGTEALFNHALSIGADPNAMTITTDNESALHHAILWDNIAAVRSLVRAGADIEHEDAGGQTPLLVAIKQNINMAVDILLESGARFDSNRVRALHIAAQVNNCYVIQTLLRKGADPNVLNPAGQTALHMAAGTDSVSAISALVLGGAILEEVNLMGKTPLNVALENGCSAAAKGLTRCGAGTSIQSQLGNKSATPAVQNCEFRIASLSRDKGQKLGHSVRGKWGYVRSAIFMTHDNAPTSSWLYEQTFGPEFDFKEFPQIFGKSHLPDLKHQFCQDYDDCQTTVHRLFKGGIDMSQRDAKGMTLAHVFVEERCLVGLRVLVEEYEAPIDQLNNDHETPLMLAIRSGFYAIAEFLDSSQRRPWERFLLASDWRSLYGRKRY